MVGGSDVGGRIVNVHQRCAAFCVFFQLGWSPSPNRVVIFCWCVGASRPTQCVVIDRLEPLAQQPFRRSFHVYSVAQLFGDSFEGEGWRPRYKCAPSVYQLLVGFLDLGWSLSPNRAHKTTTHHPSHTAHHAPTPSPPHQPANNPGTEGREMHRAPHTPPNLEQRDAQGTRQWHCPAPSMTPLSDQQFTMDREYSHGNNLISPHPSIHVRSPIQTPWRQHFFVAGFSVSPSVDRDREMELH